MPYASRQKRIGSNIIRLGRLIIRCTTSDKVPSKKQTATTPQISNQPKKTQLSAAAKLPSRSTKSKPWKSSDRRFAAKSASQPIKFANLATSYQQSLDLRCLWCLSLSSLIDQSLAWLWPTPHREVLSQKISLSTQQPR